MLLCSAEDGLGHAGDSNSCKPEAAGRGLSLISAITAQHRCVVIDFCLQQY
ncbi:hypothetical protein ALQ93_101810 [Pseudomonas syringae pv. pisi]|uniref:Uncharacterized protein n=3 Tax=Pseudomonas syringae group TaxID=136849 RepID=A0A3M3U3G6_PSESJ|nr:hypothetical protein ALQ93_101810 [Pseudomonas syringae pv. pisi]RMU70534.1 hypothetical protein ALP24_102192 [Pseudomonas syringae pv. aptata]RMU89985.1 hypothetical protein ALP21_101564 [Pseudomonas savastanoi pv. phaseolicola]RML61412.1 hypothetical protein ALQ92_101518 [Pseudomonas syringae pv. pisi]RMM29409.1 hypothetical protein ALQ82_101489 [Pseudomonas syringae pv. pisi]